MDANNSTARARCAVEDAIAAVEAQIAAPTASGGIPISQLQKFHSNLVAILGDVDRIAKGERPRPVSGLGHVIVDSWPLGSPMGGAILGAEQKYEELLKRWGGMKSDR